MTTGHAWVKLHALAGGLAVDSSVSERCRKGGVAVRRNVYNTPLWTSPQGDIPQEVYIGGLVVAVNLYGESPWLLRHDAESDSVVLEHAPSASLWPATYVDDLAGLAHDEIRGRANLYGGAALAFFSPRTCYFFSDGTACRFCSLDGTRRESRAYEDFLRPDAVAGVVRSILGEDAARIEQVMIVGGNMRDLDRGFEHHMALAHAASAAIGERGLAADISVHVATMPPRNKQLIKRAAEVENLHVMFNLEVWDEERFREICPGKHRDYGRAGMIDALKALRDTIGPYRAHSLLIVGLEEPGSTLAGATALAEEGISPILNVYHSDRHSSLGLGHRPGFAALAEVARGLQELYAEYPILPYWRHCGRNALDSEAQSRLFDEPVPVFLQGEL